MLHILEKNTKVNFKTNSDLLERAKKIIAAGLRVGGVIYPLYNTSALF